MRPEMGLFYCPFMLHYGAVLASISLESSCGAFLTKLASKLLGEGHDTD